MLKYFALILQKINKYNFTAFQNQIGITQCFVNKILSLIFMIQAIKRDKTL